VVIRQNMAVPELFSSLAKLMNYACVRADFRLWKYHPDSHNFAPFLD
jgi:hypothetical protein